MQRRRNKKGDRVTVGWRVTKENPVFSEAELKQFLGDDATVKGFT